MHSFPINCSLQRGLASIKSEPIVQLRILRHRAQPPVWLDLLTAQGHGIRAISEIEYVGPRHEVGRISIRGLNEEDMAASVRNLGKFWKQQIISAPRWLLSPRDLAVLNFRDDTMDVDTGIIFSDAHNELTIASSSFPGCVDIRSISDEGAAVSLDLLEYRPEFAAEHVTKRRI
jgi:hypothetical protein